MKFSHATIIGLSVGVFVASATLAEANSVVVSQDPYSWGVSGEFSADTTGNFAANYAPAATYNGGFETFCTEVAVVFYPTLTYSYTLSDLDSDGRALTEGAAFLYYEFAIGNLTGYNYFDAPARVGDAVELQVAIWAFQGNQSFPGYPPAATDPFYNLAIDALGANDANSPNDGRYPVDMLQLWYGTTAGQNQLVYIPTIPIPDSGSTAGMLTLACSGSVCLRRRAQRQSQAAAS